MCCAIRVVPTEQAWLLFPASSRTWPTVIPQLDVRNEYSRVNKLADRFNVVDPPTYCLRCIEAPVELKVLLKLAPNCSVC